MALQFAVSFFSMLFYPPFLQGKFLIMLLISTVHEVVSKAFCVPHYLLTGHWVYKGGSNAHVWHAAAGCNQAHMS